MRWRWAATLGISGLCLYLAVVLVPRSVHGVPVPFLVLVPTALLGTALPTHALLRGLSARGRVAEARLADVTAATASVLVSLLVLDVAYAVSLNARRGRDLQGVAERSSDPAVWTTEGLPPRFYPAEGRFRVYKPGVTIHLDTFGDLYYRDLARVPTVAGQVLQRRRLTYGIDANGFRETTPVGQARILALGDSYVFGVGVDQDQTWVERLEQLTSQPTYNLGVSGLSPSEELLLLEHFLASQNGSLEQAREVLWMVFEGNDLEESYSRRRTLDGAGRHGLFADTLLEPLLSLPSLVRGQSVLGRLWRGELRARTRARSSADPFVVDGVRLLFPLYRSSKYGAALFYPPYIEAASASEAYVLGHRNRLALDACLRDMASLARRNDLRVTVLLAPSAATLHGRLFEGFPTTSAESRFLDYVDRASRTVGFDVVDLQRRMRNCADTEYLYWRDDTHWNPGGHRCVAEIVARALAGRPPAAP